jgi:hypothetical protein
VYENFGSPFGFGDPEPLRPQEPIGEAQKILSGLLAELPEEALAIVTKVEREIDKLREKASDEAAEVRQAAETKVSEVEARCDSRCKSLLQHATEQLGAMQKDLFRSGDLGKALATFVQIQAFTTKLHDVLPDPGNLVRYHQVGKTFRFRVTGSLEGPVWGSDVYTSDSRLATAAVHAGAVEVDEEGVVKVSIFDMSGMPVRGSMAHGVMSMNWGPYPVGYRVTVG